MIQTGWDTRAIPERIVDRQENSEKWSGFQRSVGTVQRILMKLHSNLTSGNTSGMTRNLIVQKTGLARLGRLGQSCM